MSIRFYCNSGSTLHVLNRRVCNNQKDCEDSSDEMDCSNKTHFYCNDTGEPKFIAKKQICDGSEDCKSGVDECLDRCISSAFSNIDLMISNEYFVAFIWIISLLAVIGNLFVASRSIRNIFFPKQQLSKIELINKSLIFNLSLSDLLVGIYTLAICIKNATITKDYCKTDRQWRSGSTCSALGTLLLIGSENSVFTLTIITGFRMKTVLRPFAKETSMKMIACLMALSWVICILLGLIPVFNFTQDFFIDSIWYDRHPLYSTINKNDVENLSRALLTKQRFEDDPAIEKKLGTWSLLESLISDLNSTYKVERRFGYYSTHGVCLPTLFPNPDTDTAWLYSLFILIVNFLAFFVIFIGYVKIYRKTQEKNAAVSDKLKAERAIKMQQKISRIILTDFLCWMPVCIMGFLQVSEYLFFYKSIKISYYAYVIFLSIQASTYHMMHTFL
ncbi:G-protein coupled receptor GRL101-like [Styela clava]